MKDHQLYLNIISKNLNLRDTASPSETVVLMKMDKESGTPKYVANMMLELYSEIKSVNPQATLKDLISLEKEAMGDYEYHNKLAVSCHQLSLQ